MQEEQQASKTNSRRSKRRLRRAILVAAVAYIASYTVLSMCGEQVYCQTGKVRYGMGFAVSDIAHWHPYGVYWEPFVYVSGQHGFRADPVGWVYAPLIWMDRRWVHRTEVIIDPETLNKK